MRDLTKGDIAFIHALCLPYFRVSRVRFRVTEGVAPYPDIWAYTWKPTPLIVANQTWARKSTRQRRVEIVHEMLHIVGMKHNRRIGYNSRPELDTFSRRVYMDIVNNAGLIRRRMYRFERGRFRV